MIGFDRKSPMADVDQWLIGYMTAAVLLFFAMAILVSL